MDAAEFLNAVPDLTPIIGDAEDVRQNVFLRLWEKGDTIQNMARYARRAAKRAANDASERRGREAERVESLDDDRFGVVESLSPLDAMIDVEDRDRVREAASQLPRCQRDAIAFEIDPARQSSDVETRPPHKSHRSNLYKATKRLRGSNRIADRACGSR